MENSRLKKNKYTKITVKYPVNKDKTNCTMGWFDLDSRGCVLPVINSDGDVWKISVTEDKVCKEDLEQPQEERHPDCGSEKKRT